MKKQYSLDTEVKFLRQSLLSRTVIIAGMRQSRPNCNIFGQARRPAPTKACRGDSLWSPRSKKFDFDASLVIIGLVNPGR
jgi:hypothetical protein